MYFMRSICSWPDLTQNNIHTYCTCGWWKSAVSVETMFAGSSGDWGFISMVVLKPDVLWVYRSRSICRGIHFFGPPDPDLSLKFYGSGTYFRLFLHNGSAYRSSSSEYKDIQISILSASTPPSTWWTLWGRTFPWHTRAPWWWIARAPQTISSQWWGAEMVISWSYMISLERRASTPGSTRKSQVSVKFVYLLFWICKYFVKVS